MSTSTKNHLTSDSWALRGIVSDSVLLTGRALLVVTAVTWAPSVVIWHAVMALFPGPEMPDVFAEPRAAILGGILLAPLLETLILRWLLRFFRSRGVQHRQKLALLGALFFWAMHFKSPSWGLHAAWGFYVMSLCFIEAEKRSLNYALGVVTLIHMVCNALTYAVSLIIAR